MVSGKDILDKSPFLMQPRKAIEASEAGLCGRCGEKIEGKKYDSSVFIRTIWGPPGKSLESSGYRRPIFICEECKLGNLQFELAGAIGRVGRLKEEIEKIRGSTAEAESDEQKT